MAKELFKFYLQHVYIKRVAGVSTGHGGFPWLQSPSAEGWEKKNFIR